jgi:hypothetical protein
MAFASCRNYTSSLRWVKSFSNRKKKPPDRSGGVARKKTATSYFPVDRFSPLLWPRYVLVWANRSPCVPSRR